MYTSGLHLPKTTPVRVTRSSYRTLGPPLRPSSVVVTPVKHHPFGTPYEDYEEDEKPQHKPKPARAAPRTRASAIISSEDDHKKEIATAKSRVDKRAASMTLVKRSRKVSPITSSPKTKAGNKKASSNAILTRSAAVTKPASKAMVAAPKASANTTKPITPPQTRKITRSANLSTIAQKALDEISAASRVRLGELKLSKTSGPVQTRSASVIKSTPVAAPAPRAVKASSKTGSRTAASVASNRITRSANLAASKVTKVKKPALSPDKRLGKPGKSSKITAVSAKGPVSGRTRSQTVTRMYDAPATRYKLRMELC